MKPLNPEFLALLLGMLIRKYGAHGTLILENYIAQVEGLPKRIGLSAGIYGPDLIIHMIADEGGEVITSEDLRLAELETEGEGELVN